MTTPKTYTAALLVLDATDAGQLVAHRPDTRTDAVPETVTDLASAAEWALAYGLGAGALSQYGEEHAGLLVLTEAAMGHFGLPAELEDRRLLRLAEDHQAVKAVEAAGWKLSKRGLSPWAMLYHDRSAVHFAFVGWEAFSKSGWDLDTTDPAALAYTLGLYSERVITPTGSTAGNGLALMTALRPATRPAYNRETGRMQRVPVPGSLHQAVEAAPCELPKEHPLAEGRTREENADPAHVLFEEALVWHRAPTAEEAGLPWAVAIDINTAFLAAASRLNVGTSAPVHTDGPRFDKKVPGSWLVDLTGVDLDPRLPNPFTPDGTRPTGPAWYATPTLAYAVELGADVRPLEAWLRPEASGYLDLWNQRLRDAYMATMGDLGITPDMPEEAFLAALADKENRDPEALALLTAIKQTAKGGIGKLRERPYGKREGRNAPWTALKRPTWRPDIRAAVIAAARVNMHRKLVKTATVTGRYPLAVNTDCIVYASTHPTARAVVPRKPDGSGDPLPGGFRIGPNPGYCKEEGVQSMEWLRALVADDSNPARYIKDGITAADDE